MKKFYNFQRPAGTRYIVNINEWNKVFADRGRWPFTTCHAFVDRERGIAEIHFYHTWAAKVVMGLLFPVLVMVAGFKVAAETIKDDWFQKERGTFPSDEAFSGSKDWDKLMKLIGSENGR